MSERISRRRFLGTAVATMGVALLAACGAAPGATPPPKSAALPAKSATGPAVKIRLLTGQWWKGITGQEDARKATYEDWWKFIFEEFKKASPQYARATLQLEVAPSAVLSQKLNAAIASRAWPDIYVNRATEALTFAPQGLVEPIDTFLTAEDKNDFQQGTLEAGQYQGKLYAWPWNADGTCLLVNKSIFQAARSTDVMPDADGFWEFGQCLLAFAVATATSKDRYGFATSFKDYTDPYQRYSFLWGFGASIFSTIGIERYTFDWPLAEAGLEWLVELDYKQKLMMPGLAEATSADIISSFVKGKVAIIPATTAWNSAYFQSLYNKGEADPAKLDVIPAMFPNLIETDPLRTYADIHSWIVFKQTDAYKRQLLMDFCAYCCNADNQKWSVPAKYLPVRKSAADVWGSDSIMQFMSRWSLTYAHPDGIHPLFKDVHKILVPAFQQALTRAKTPVQALQDAATDVNKLIAS